MASKKQQLHPDAKTTKDSKPKENRLQTEYAIRHETPERFAYDAYVAFTQGYCSLADVRMKLEGVCGDWNRLADGHTPQGKVRVEQGRKVDAEDIFQERIRLGCEQPPPTCKDKKGVV